MDLKPANVVVDVFWKKNLSGPLNVKQEEFKTSYPRILEFANESEFEFFFHCTQSSVLFTFLQVFGIVLNKKNLDFLKDIVDGNVAKVKKFLRVNKSKKDATSLRIAVNLSCSFNQPEVLDILIKNLDREFLAKFEHIFLSLKLLFSKSDSASTLIKIFSWCKEPHIKVDLNTPHRDKNDNSCPNFKTILMAASPKIFKLALEYEMIKVDSDEWVELFEGASEIWVSLKKDMKEDAFNIFPSHDYFLAKHREDVEIYQRQEFYDDDSADSSDAATDVQVSEDEINQEFNADADKVDEDEEASNDTECVENKTLCEKYGIRSDISEEDLIEIMVLFDEVMSVSIREIMKKILVDKLTKMLEEDC